MKISDISDKLITLAILEDVAGGDITTDALLEADVTGSAQLISKQKLVVCGHQLAREVFSRVDSNLVYEYLAEDGARVESGSVIASVSGPMRGILTAERTALNFLQRLSGIATTTARLVAKVAATKVALLDTRKTTPGWRELEKYAVGIAGGVNHRQGLYDEFMIKNNHIDARGGDVVKAIRDCRSANGEKTLTVEVRTQQELEAALDEKPDRILLDNMSPAELRAAVAFVRASNAGSGVQLEASGGITEDTLEDYASTGVDSISLGMLTHSVKAADISLRYLK